LGVNIYVVGINQLTDVEIDRINKPYLPLASGAFLIKRRGCSSCASRWLCRCPLPPRRARTSTERSSSVFALGTAYSLPPFPAEKSAFLGGLCDHGCTRAGGEHRRLSALHISTVRHPLATDERAGVRRVHCSLFVVVIAIMKDVPDIEAISNCDVPTLPGVWESMERCSCVAGSCRSRASALV